MQWARAQRWATSVWTPAPQSRLDMDVQPPCATAACERPQRLWLHHTPGAATWVRRVYSAAVTAARCGGRCGGVQCRAGGEGIRVWQRGAHRKDRLCGAIGVMTRQGTLGATMGPPADMLYAVDPDGVATMRPSPCRASAESPHQCHRHISGIATTTGREQRHHC